jgi:hypothetical protein
MVCAYAIILLGVLTLLLRHHAFGHCKACNLDREPRCGCDPNNERKPWKNSGS